MDRYRVNPGEIIDLDRWDPSDCSAMPNEEKAKKEFARLNEKLETLQETLYAEHKHKLLIVLQAMDAGGKDGVIRKVFDGVNPQGVRVASFKAPSAEELDHDYLWRIHAQTPRRGEIVIFNRSHYEDVLVARVRKLVSSEVWQRRYQQINDFERMLCEEGATILKFYLHISKEEQRKRLQSRIETPHKRWKFDAGDLAERKRWPQYMEAYEEAISRTSTQWAPWYIVPADSNACRNLIVCRVIVEALERLEMRYPEPKIDLSKVVIE